MVCSAGRRKRRRAQGPFAVAIIVDRSIVHTSSLDGHVSLTVMMCRIQENFDVNKLETCVGRKIMVFAKALSMDP